MSTLLPPVGKRSIVLVTGARQTGKTTLVRSGYAQLPYYNLDAIELREQLGRISSFRWGLDVGEAVIDEVQKAPQLMEKLKYAMDEQAIRFSVLTGSAQLMLLRSVRETLAGRITLFELFPFMFQEMLAPDRVVRPEPLFFKLVSGGSLDEVLEALPSVLLGMEQDKAAQTESFLYTVGGMPPLIHIALERERQFWTSDYNQTYLERDLADLASLNDLKPFRRFHQLSALRAGQLLSYSDLARDAGIAVETARRYLEYLRISYQAFLVQPYYRNLTSTLVKTPKLYWFDNGLLRHLSGLGSVPDTGSLYENYLAAELMKYIRTMRLDLKLYFYLTRSGMEVDFLLESTAGVLGIEVKNRDDVVKSDFSRLKALGQALGEAWLGGLVVYRGNTLYQQEPGFWAVPSTRLLQ